MNSREFSKKWPELKKQLKQAHPELTEEELLYEIGKEEELLLRLQERLGRNWKKTREWLALLG